MKYSILFLSYDPEHKVCDIMKESIHSVITHSTGHDYEIIVCDRDGLQRDINRGFRQARGDYIIILMDDVVIENNWLDYMAVPGHITSWKATTSSWNPDKITQELDFSCICFPREIREKIGDMDEQFANGYGYDDNDYLYRAALLDIPFLGVPVKLKHETSVTMTAYNRHTHDKMGANRDLILKKYSLGYHKK